MEIRVLGPIEAWEGGHRIPLGGPRQRTLLALLALNANQAIAADRLIEDLWGGDPPETSRKSLQVYISRLRRLLDNGAASPLVTRSPGYALVLGSDQMDVLRFRDLLQEGQDLLRHDPARAGTRLRQALAEWRGPALQDLADESALSIDIQRLEDERLGALEARIDADLAMGRHAELIGELESLCHLYPYRERFTAQSMLALYRSGRQTEALRRYNSTRETLVEELGLEPSPELQELEEGILRHDPQLRLGMRSTEPVPRGEAPAQPIMRGYELREELDRDAWGTRFRAYQTATGSEVIVKIIAPRLARHPDFIRRFTYEATRLAHLHHPSIASVIDFWRDQEGAYVVSNPPPGELLDGLLSRGDQPSIETPSLLETVAEALDAAHHQGFVHGNLVASKVLLGEDGNVMLTDFGLSHDLVDHDGGSVSAADDLAAFDRLIDDVTATWPVPGWNPAPRSSSGGDRDGALAMVRRSIPIREGTSRTPAPNPYKGLRAFGEPDAADFFGREALVDQLVGRLSRPGPNGRLVAIVGPSGSGKSSLVQAGLIPAVHEKRISGAAHWFVGRLVPGERPFEELEAVLLRLAINPPASLLEQLEDGELGLHRALLRILPDDDSELFLVIDQFEELFTAAPEVAPSFLAALSAALVERRSRLRLAITLRADFYDRPLLHPTFGELLSRGLFTLTAMSPQEVERAIVGPAQRVGVEVERALVVEMAADVADQPAALPLLQYALTELFDHRSDDVLTLDGYRAVGGVHGALGRRAEQLFQQLDAQAREAVRHVFLRLVVVEEGTDLARRRVHRNELISMQLERGLIAGILDQFGEARLLSFDRDRVTRAPTVEVAHEALLHRWERLAAWIEDAADDVRMQRRLSALVREWSSSGRDEEFLLAPGRLEQFTEWERDREMTLTEEEREFLEASARHQANEQRSALERLAHERDLERRAASRLRLLLAGLVVASVIGLSLTLLALDREADARRWGARAEAVGLSAAAIANTEVDGQLALNLALHAWALAQDADVPIPEETEAAVHLALQSERVGYPPKAGRASVVLGPGGPRGIYRIPSADLLELATSNLKRSLTDEECLTYLGEPTCPPLEVEGAANPELGDREVEDGSKPLAGTRVMVGSAWVGEWTPLLLGNFRDFEDATGIDIVSDAREEYDHDSGYLDDMRPDIALVSQPGRIASLAKAGQLLELTDRVDQRNLRSDYSAGLLSLVTLGADGSSPSLTGALYGAPVLVNAKSLIWYRPDVFEARGYEVPSDWGALLSLSHTIVAEGGTPWCMGEHSGGPNGWPATDWIEDILLHSAGPAVYDSWVSHDIPFDHPEVVRAAQLLGEIYFEPGFVAGGPEGAIRTEIQVAAEPLFQEPPGCFMFHFPSFAPTFFPPGVEVGRDVTNFPFPSIDPAYDSASVGSAEMVIVLNDRPEVWEAVRYMVSPGWGIPLVEDSRRGYPPNLRFSRVRSSEFDRSQIEQIHGAISTDQFRFDGSDLMPPEVGLGSFLQGMIDYIRSGPDHADRVLQEIEESWPGG